MRKTPRLIGPKRVYELLAVDALPTPQRVFHALCTGAWKPIPQISAEIDISDKIVRRYIAGLQNQQLVTSRPCPDRARVTEYRLVGVSA